MRSEPSLSFDQTPTAFRLGATGCRTLPSKSETRCRILLRRCGWRSPRGRTGKTRPSSPGRRAGNDTENLGCRRLPLQRLLQFTSEPSDSSASRIGVDEDRQFWTHRGAWSLTPCGLALWMGFAACCWSAVSSLSPLGLVGGIVAGLRASPEVALIVRV